MPTIEQQQLLVASRLAQSVKVVLDDWPYRPPERIEADRAAMRGFLDEWDRLQPRARRRPRDEAVACPDCGQPWSRVDEDRATGTRNVVCAAGHSHRARRVARDPDGLHVYLER